MKGFVGEIFSSFQGEGIYAGRRQVFVRFAGCPLRCCYCDTAEFRNFNLPHCLVERRAGSGHFRKLRNPLRASEVLREVLRLRTPDLHSVSLTGGEPLSAGEFLVEVARGCKKLGFKTYLETSGAGNRLMGNLVRYLDYVAIDLKLPEHRAVPIPAWPALLEEELKCVCLAVERGVETFVKIVVLRTTKPRTLKEVCRRLKAVARVPVVLQPVTPRRGENWSVEAKLLFKNAEAVSSLGFEVAIIPQVHKLLRLK
jgi:organic radical activating enzyme